MSLMPGISLAPVLSAVLVACWAASVPGQFIVSRGPVDLAGETDVPGVDSNTRTHLERLAAFLENGQRADAVETYLQLIDEHGSELMPLSDAARPGYVRHVPLRDFVHWQLARRAATDPEVLTVYRQWVDPVAQRRWNEARDELSRGALRTVIDRYFLSSVTDQALDALAELSVRDGHLDEARFCWERMHAAARVPMRDATHEPFPHARAGNPLWLALGADSSRSSQDSLWGPDASTGELPTLAFPDADLSWEQAWARMVLASILSGDLTRAARELDHLRRWAPEAEGTWSGRKVNWGEQLATLLVDAANWPTDRLPNEWSSFAADVQRTGRASSLDDVRLQPAWRVDLQPAYYRLPFDTSIELDLGYPDLRPGERGEHSLSFYPLLVDGRVYVSDGRRILAFDLEHGQSGSPVAASGEIFPLDDSEHATDLHQGIVGTPRFLLEASGDWLVARLGNPVTVSNERGRSRRDDQQVVVLDRRTNKTLALWRLPAEEWAFDGCPVIHQGKLFGTLRRSDVQTQVFVACFDVATQSVDWQTFVCSGATIGQGEVNEITHNLLTLHQGRLYLNTNLGAVAALSADEGRLLWITQYPRSGTVAATRDQPAWHVRRDLTPCCVDRGHVYVLPADTEQLLCFEAMTGLLVWETRLAVGQFDATSVVGVVEEHVVVSGRRLWWIDRRTGRLSSQVPHNPFPADPRAELVGCGRPVLAGRRLFWPAAAAGDEIHVLDAVTGVVLRQPLLMPEGTHVGNLSAAEGMLVIATDKELVALQAVP
ncbi:MAG: PQQ-binding-like beta-propeller repeat protein [Planctomycetales bacterium]|nr:PQQ-binding-like beta-propeller repeat protein [Planctomycetales bacterium]